jgi:hypothetical protein
VEVSEFCLFFEVFPARCISIVSPRVYFRKHAFCFLPPVTILESLILRYVYTPLSTSLEDDFVVQFQHTEH